MDDVQLEAVLERLLAPVAERLKRRLEMPPQEWFSVEETAALTGMSDDFVRRHVTSGLLVSLLNTALQPIVERLDRLGRFEKQQVVPPELPTRKAAQYIGVDVKTLRALRKLGLIRYRNASPPGSGKPRHRYPVADLDRLMQQGYRRDLPRPAKAPARRRQQVQPQTYEHLNLE